MYFSDWILFFKWIFCSAVFRRVPPCSMEHFCSESVRNRVFRTQTDCVQNFSSQLQKNSQSSDGLKAHGHILEIGPHLWNLLGSRWIFTFWNHEKTCFFHFGGRYLDDQRELGQVFTFKIYLLSINFALKAVRVDFQYNGKNFARLKKNPSILQASLRFPMRSSYAYSV